MPSRVIDAFFAYLSSTRNANKMSPFRAYEDGYDSGELALGADATLQLHRPIPKRPIG